MHSTSTAHADSSFTTSTAEKARIRVAVVDDHPAVCEAVRAALEKEPGMAYCGGAGDAESALQLVGSCLPDVAVVDLSLRDAHGFTMVSTISSRYPSVRVVVYSMGKEAAYAERAIRAGALAYVSKSEPTRAVIEAIRSAHKGTVYVNQALALRLVSDLMRGGSRQHASSSTHGLTNQEAAVVQLLGMGHQVDSIAGILKLNSRTVQAYQRRAMGKLGYDTLGELLHFAMSTSV